METPAGAASPSRRAVYQADALTAIGVFVFSLLVAIIGASDYGFTWDETETNFPAARRQVEWFRLFFQGDISFSESSVREYFYTESDHPSLPRTWMALARIAVPSSVSDRIAFGLSTSAQFALFLAVYCVVIRRRYGTLAALTSCGLLLFHPRLLAHAHIAEYDLPIMVWWFLAAIAFYAAANRARPEGESWVSDWGPMVGAAALVGIALCVKLHAFFLPFPLLAWAVFARKWNVWKWCVGCAILSPVLYILSQPYLWWDTIDRVQARFVDYSAKWPITVYYLGDLYAGDLPWHYPWVLLGATTPLALGLLALLGGAVSVRRSESSSEERSWAVFAALNFLVIPVLFSWKSPYDGIRLFLVALPFLGVFAAKGVAWLEGAACVNQPCSTGKSKWVLIALCLCAVMGQAWTCRQVHPHGLAYYSSAVGGIRGARALGFETTYWCDGFTPDFVRELARVLPADAAIATHSCDASTFIEYQRQGIAPAGWKFTKEGAVHARVIQFRQGFFGEAELRLISEREPLVIREIDGVPLVAAYRGP